MSRISHIEYPTTRRQFLTRSGAGFGAVALAGLLADSTVASSAHESTANPLAAKPPHFKPTAKSVIFLFMEGGPSHMDLFDPKPLLNELAGKPMPESFGTVITPMGESRSPLLASKRKWKQHGEAGTWVSDWLPHAAEHVDDFAVIRSCVADGINHSAGVCQMNTCAIVGGRPSLGSWVSYGLGSENENLPAFVVLVTKGKGGQPLYSRLWGSGFLPANYQGTTMRPGPPASPAQRESRPPGTGRRRKGGCNA